MIQRRERRGCSSPSRTCLQPCGCSSGKRFQAARPFADARNAACYLRLVRVPAGASTPNSAATTTASHSTARSAKGNKLMRHTGHIRQRSPGSFELRYSIGTDPATGKRKMATATVRGSRKDAEKELRRLLRSLDIGDHVDSNRVTVREWLATWLAAVRAEVAPKTHERYGEIVSNFLVPALGNLQLAKLAPVHIQEAYNALAAGGRRDGKEGGLSPRTRRHIHRILRAALARAVEQQLLARNPADAFRKRLPKVERREMATLTAEQSQQLLA